MSGWQWGGWPPPAPGDAGGISFAAVQAALALADAPVSFNGQRITDLGAPVADGDGVNRLWDFDGSLRTQAPVMGTHQTAIVTVAPGASHDTPSPAAGFIRVLFTSLLTSNGATPSFDITLQPSGLSFVRAFSVGAATGPSVAGGLSGTGAYQYGTAEFIRYSNIGTAGAQLWYSYYDIPDTGLTLIRAPFTEVATTIIPAPAVGFYRRFQVSQLMGANLTTRPSQQIVNDDTAAAVVQGLLGGVVVTRNGSQGANTNTFSFLGGGALIVTPTNGPLQIQAQAAPATRPLNFFGTYQTFAGTP